MEPLHFKSRSSLIPPVFFRVILIFFFLSQVAVAQQKKKNSVGPAGGEIEISPIELRETMNDFFYKFSRTISESADSIMRISSNSGVKNEALKWKMNAIPIANSAIYTSDPFLGYVDMAVFTYQLKQYFEEGAGKNLFGSHQMIAIEAVDLLWEDLLDIGRNLVPDNDISEGTKIVTDFATEHPLKSSYFVRQSTIPLMAKIQTAEKVTFKGLAVDMSQSIDGLRSQVSSYMEILPQQARWEAEFLLNNTLNNPDITNRIDSLAGLLERSVILLESTPEIIDIQRKTSFADIRAERIAVLQAIQQEREIILEEIKSEREIVLSILTEQLNLQREATFRDLTTLTNQSLDRTFDRMEEMVNTLYWRTGIIIAGLVVLVFVGLIVYKKI